MAGITLSLTKDIVSAMEVVQHTKHSITLIEPATESGLESLCGLKASPLTWRDGSRDSQMKGGKGSDSHCD